MSWPHSQEYNEAIQSPTTSFADPELRTGEVVTNDLGLPIPCSGNFADVYEVRCPNGTSWAVKCFTREVAGLRERYQEISRALLQAKLPFTVEFTYLEQGIRIRGAWYPILKMQWVEGFTLNDFVRQHLDKPAMLNGLLQIWGRMATRLRDSGIAHADLQHGNVLLVPGSSASSVAVKLIDYDGMFVPSLASKKSGEVGHPNFQHPQRLREGIYSREVDRFPLLLIAASLRCLKVGGRELWEKYDNGDNLLFREHDLKAPAESALFRELEALPDAGARDLVGQLRQALAGRLEAAPLLDEALLKLPATSAVSGVPAVMPMVPNAGVTYWHEEPKAASTAAPASPKTVLTMATAAAVLAKRPVPPIPREQPRNWWVVGTIMAVVCVLIALAMGGGGIWWITQKRLGAKPEAARRQQEAKPEAARRQQEVEQEAAERQRNLEEAERKLKSTLKAARQPQYRDNLTSIRSALDKNDYEQALALLNQQPQDLRDKEWQLLATVQEKASRAAAEASRSKEYPKTLSVDLGGDVRMEFVLIPKGKFTMGSPKEEKGRRGEEDQHEVEITKPFYLAKYPVTQEQYQAIMKVNPSYFQAGKGGADKVKGLDTKRFPVETVSWDDAQVFCKRMGANDKQGRTFRLPTEAEWEYACRAGTRTAYFYGDDPNKLGDYAWFKDNSESRTHEVGTRQANSWGLYDMHGNVWQWCEDCYDSKYYASSTIKDPLNLKTLRASGRVFRSGSWGNYGVDCRASFRYSNAPTFRYYSLGCRLAQVPVQ